MSLSSPVKPAGTPTEALGRLLDASAARLAEPEGLEVPEDEIHREILVPLLPAMLGDKAIRQHWREQVATGFLARLAVHLEGDAPAPRWQAGDFEIHVSASYLAGPDAKALADTLLSEESFRDLTATLMNQVLEAVWSSLPAAAPVKVVVKPVPEPVEAVEPVVESVEELVESVEVEEAVEAVEAASEVEEAPMEEGVEVEASLFPLPVSALPVIERIIIRPNPIRGTVHTFGGLGQWGWQARNPLKRRWR